MVPTASLTPRVAGTSSCGAHRPSFFARPLQTRPASTEAQPRALTFRVSRQPAAEEETAGGRSLTPAVLPAPPKAQKAIRKAAKPRAKRGAKKNATAAPTGTAAGGARGSLALPPTAESQIGGTPLAPPPPVHPVGERPASSVVTASTLTTVFAEGLRPVCVHLAGLSKKLDEVHDSVNRLSTNLHNQGVGNERTAQAVVQLQGAVKGVYDGVVAHSKQEPVAAGTLRGSTAMPEDYEEQLQLAILNEEEMSSVRDVTKLRMTEEMIGSTRSFQALPSRARGLKILFEACETVRGVDRKGAQDYMASQRLFLTAAGTPAESRARVSEKLYRVRDHVIEALQKVAMAAYIKELAVCEETMICKEAEAWLENGKYTRSPKAGPAINAALKAIFRRNGQKARIIEPKEVGETVFVDATTGHVGLIAHWGRDVYEKAAGVRKPRRTGNDDGSYDVWRAEVRNVSKLLRRHDDVEAGLRLCDGSNKLRAMNVADYGTFVIEESDTDESEKSASTSEQDPEEGEDLGVSNLAPEYVPGVDGVDVDTAGVGILGQDLEGEKDVAGGDEGSYAAEVVGSGDLISEVAGIGSDEAVGGGEVAVVRDGMDAREAACSGNDVAAEHVARAGEGSALGDVAGAGDGIDAGKNDDSGDLGPAPPGLLPESSAYPGGFGEYFQEDPP